MKRLLLLAVPLLLALPAFADQINIHQVFPWGSGPSLTPGVDQLLVGQRNNYAGYPLTTLSFQGTFDFPQKASILTWTFAVDNVPTPSFFDFTPYCSVVLCSTVGQLYIIPLVNKTPVAGTLTINLNGKTTIYDFHYVTAAPEPTSLLLLGTGLAVLAWLKRRSLSHRAHEGSARPPS